MGGVAGHMSHLYDNPSLSFLKMKEIMAAVAEGDLVAEEKVDGQNLFISFSEKEGIAKAARNLSNLRKGGLTARELAHKFADRGVLTAAFTNGFETFEKAVNALTPNQRVAVFGSDANVWYNAEIMDPASKNVISYDEKIIKIHDTGHFIYDKATGKKIFEGLEDRLDLLDGQLELMQRTISEDDFQIMRRAVVQLQKLSDDTILSDAYQKIDIALSDAGRTEKDNVGSYVYSRIYAGIDSEIRGSLKDEIVKYLLKLPGNVGLRALKKGLKEDELEDLNDIIRNKSEILNMAISPIEMVVHEFSVEVLKGIQSLFIVDGSAEVERIRKELANAVNDITEKGEDDPNSMEILQRHLNKIGDMSRITTPVEGIVFQYDDHIYKFTGNYAPINQILGLFKYGRVSKGVTSEGIYTKGEILSEISGKRIALFPGKFKPPHKGHLQYVNKIANRKDVDEVKIIISPVNRNEVNNEQALKIWNLYLAGANPKISVEVSEYRSPVQGVYEFVADSMKVSDGDTVLLIKSSKDVGDTRFDGAQSYAERKNPGVKVDYIIEDPVKSRDGTVYSARDMRQAISVGDKDTFLKYLPNTVDKDMIWNIVSSDIGESMNIDNFVDSKIEEMSAMGAGAVEGPAGTVGFGSPNTYNPYKKTTTIRPKVKKAKRQRRR